MFESIRQLLASLCRRRTLLMVLDDVHWADAPSLRLLEFLAPELGSNRLLLVGTCRATELSRHHPLSNTLGALARVPHFARITRELGGTGLTLAEVCREQRSLAYHAPATALGVNMHLYWVGVAADLWR
jgi:hypothetical protein